MARFFRRRKFCRFTAEGIEQIDYKDLGILKAYITETGSHNGGQGHDFTVTLDVVEPLGMETMVFFKINGNEVCGRVEPSAARGAGESMPLRANLDHMHLIDPATNLVV